MSRTYRYALICFLVGCIPPPGGGYPVQTYSSSQQRGYEDGNGDDGAAAGQWTCTAEASFGTANGDGDMSYSVKTGYGTATTREQAETLALKDCGEAVNTAILIAEGMSQENGSCGLAGCRNNGR